MSSVGGGVFGVLLGWFKVSFGVPRSPSYVHPLFISHSHRTLSFIYNFARLWIKEESLLVFSCFNMTSSPISKSDVVALLRLSAYSFPFILLVQSRSDISLSNLCPTWPVVDIQNWGPGGKF